MICHGPMPTKFPGPQSSAWRGGVELATAALGRTQVHIHIVTRNIAATEIRIKIRMQ